jgi:hypothetical protein
MGPAIKPKVVSMFSAEFATAASCGKGVLQIMALISRTTFLRFYLILCSSNSTQKKKIERTKNRQSYITA